MSGEGDWGARIRTWDHGTKTRCLTAWPRPRAMPNSSGGRRRDRRARATAKITTAMITAHFTIQARITPITAKSCEAAKIQRIWRTIWERLSRPPRHAEHGDDGERDHGPLREVVREENDDRLGRGDPEREPRPPLVKPEPGPARAAVDGARRVAQHASTVPRRCRQPGAPDAAAAHASLPSPAPRDGRGRRPSGRRRSRRRGTRRVRSARRRAATKRGRSRGARRDRAGV